MSAIRASLCAIPGANAPICPLFQIVALSIWNTCLVSHLSTAHIPSVVNELWNHGNGLVHFGSIRFMHSTKHFQLFRGCHLRSSSVLVINESRKRFCPSWECRARERNGTFIKDSAVRIRSLAMDSSVSKHLLSTLRISLKTSGNIGLVSAKLSSHFADQNRPYQEN